LVESYTREAGVRSLERVIASVCREMAVRLAEMKEVDNVAVTKELVIEIMGPVIYQPEVTESSLAAGIAAGLGVGSAGGELLIVEVSQMPGKGNVHVTGSLGPVLKEAAQTAVSFVRSRTDKLHLPADWIKNIDIHVHIPRARAALDFAGMGAAIFAAVCSRVLHAPCRSDVAIVGELTLRGSILPVRGIKGMLLCAHRSGISHVILPARNEADVAEVPVEVLADLRITYISRVDEILPLVLQAPDPSEPEGENIDRTPEVLQ
jgi:ATP-dependent Lon protease